MGLTGTLFPQHLPWKGLSRQGFSIYSRPKFPLQAYCLPIPCLIFFRDLLPSKTTLYRPHYSPPRLQPHNVRGSVCWAGCSSRVRHRSWTMAGARGPCICSLDPGGKAGQWLQWEPRGADPETRWGQAVPFHVVGCRVYPKKHRSAHSSTLTVARWGTTHAAIKQ